MNRDLKLRLLGKRKINEITGCWLWTGVISNHYGQIKVKGKGKSVHRLALELFKGIIFGPNEQANHIKECPNKHCFNPDHLYKGEQHNNNTDKIKFICPNCGKEKKKGRCQNCKKLYMRKYMKVYYHKNKT